MNPSAPNIQTTCCVVEMEQDRGGSEVDVEKRVGVIRLMGGGCNSEYRGSCSAMVLRLKGQILCSFAVKEAQCA